MTIKEQVEKDLATSNGPAPHHMVAATIQQKWHDLKTSTKASDIQHFQLYSEICSPYPKNVLFS
jgi:hypothetical protein